MLAGEDGNDRKCLRVLLEGFCPDIRGRIVEISDSVRLWKARDSTLASRVDVLARKAKARAALEKSEIACAFVHEDLDEVDGDRYPAAHARVEKALGGAFRSAHYVLSVAEMEAWLLLFPDALTTYVSSWRVPGQVTGRDTGLIADPKKVIRDLAGGGRRRYSEPDAPEIFARAVAAEMLDAPAGSNRSWSRFRDDAMACAQQHLVRQRRP